MQKSMRVSTCVEALKNPSLSTSRERHVWLLARKSDLDPLYFLQFFPVYSHLLFPLETPDTATLY